MFQVEKKTSVFHGSAETAGQVPFTLEEMEVLDEMKRLVNGDPELPHTYSGIHKRETYVTR